MTDSQGASAKAAAKPAKQPEDSTKTQTSKKRSSSPRGASTARRRTSAGSNGQGFRMPDVPGWAAVAASVAGAGIAAGIYAVWRGYRGDHGPIWGEDGQAAFARGETDRENGVQTRGSDVDAMRDSDQDWDSIDDEIDASFPASDPPAFVGGRDSLRTSAM